MSPTKPSHKYTLLLLISLCYILPICGAWLIYQRPSLITHKLNRGTFITPTAHLDQFIHTHNAHTKDRHWQLIYLETAKTPLDPATAKQILNMKSTLGENQYRLQLTQLATPKKNQPTPPGWRRQSISPQAMQALRKTPHLDNAHPYLIVDPLQNIVLVYHKAQPINDIRADLQKLLKASRIG